MQYIIHLHRLYWLNVGRFHPLEKAVQYALDTLPFAVLAVSQEVLATYFIFYALNGFFQHSNCRVRLGLLNYIIAGPELHRWHHSATAEESNHNFGNNLIIWGFVVWYTIPAKGQGSRTSWTIEPGLPDGVSGTDGCSFHK